MKATDRLRKGATFKSTKQVWMLRTARTFVERLVVCAGILVDKNPSESGQQDLGDLKNALNLLDKVVDKNFDKGELK